MHKSSVNSSINFHRLNTLVSPALRTPSIPTFSHTPERWPLCPLLTSQLFLPVGCWLVSFILLTDMQSEQSRDSLSMLCSVSVGAAQRPGAELSWRHSGICIWTVNSQNMAGLLWHLSPSLCVVSSAQTRQFQDPNMWISWEHQAEDILHIWPASRVTQLPFHLSLRLIQLPRPTGPHLSVEKYQLHNAGRCFLPALELYITGL